MSEERDLIGKAVTLNFFGLDLPLVEERPEVPEKYEWIRELGRGGFGTVHLARDKTLDRLVALKYLSHATAADLERFRREARFAARLQHPSIVQVHEIGEAGGDHYIAMQFIDGGNLATTGLDRRETVRVIRDIAAALAAAHRQGIVHRDIKPENILVDQGNRAYLSDFGIARDLRAQVGTTLSSEGTILGTPALMSPEQARGEMHAVDGRSDVYSLGATLYERMTGRRPFDNVSLAELLYSVIHEEPPLPRSLDPGVPRGLEAIVWKCLRKEPKERYQTMDEVAAELDRWLAGASEDLGASAWFQRLVGREDVALPSSSNGADTHDTADFQADVIREIYTSDAEIYRASNLSRHCARLGALVERLDAALARRPDCAWARFYRGIANFRRNLLESALDDMERAIDRMAGQASAHFELGRLYLALYLREHDAARRHITPQGTRMHIDEMRGRIRQAQVAFDEARRQKQDLPAWQMSFAAAVIELSEARYDACIATCDRILADEQDLEEVWKLKGDAEAMAGLDPFLSYDTALRVRRSYYQVHYAKAEAHAVRGHDEKARESLLRALEIHPDFPDAVAFLAKIDLLAHRAGSPDGALDACVRRAHEALGIDPFHYEATVLLAEAYLERRNAPDEALEVLEKARALAGCQNRVNLLVAQALLQRARRTESQGGDARADYTRILDHKTDHRTAANHGTEWEEVFAEATARLAAAGAGRG